LVGMLKGFDFATIAEVGIGLQAVQRKELMQAALTATNIYIIEYAFIAGIFVALIENNLKKSIIYCLALLPASIVTFFIAGML